MSRVSTGLRDTAGKELFLGDVVKLRSANIDVHGEWVYYAVEPQGSTPILSYLKSDKGQVFPPGHAASILAVHYDTKEFLLSSDSLSLAPEDDLLLVDRLGEPAER